MTCETSVPRSLFRDLMSTLSLLILSTAVAHAQLWTPITAPMEGGYVDKLLIGRHGEIYASVSSVIYVSQDTGRHWTDVSLPDSRSLSCFGRCYNLTEIPSPGQNASLLAYPLDSRGSTMFVSSDRGTTWNESEIPLELQCSRLYIFGGRHSNLTLAFCGRGERFVVKSSVDGGRTWSTETAHYRAPSEYWQDDDGTVFVRAQDTLRSRAPTGVWSTLHTDVWRGPARAGSWLYLQGGVSNDILSSSDNGKSWRAMVMGRPDDDFPFVDGFVGSANGDIVAFCVKGHCQTEVITNSKNQNAWWYQPSPLPFWFTAKADMQFNSAIATELNGLVVIENMGTTWSARNTGIHLRDIKQFARNDATILAICDDYHLFRASVNGNAWESLSTPFDCTTFINDIISTGPSSFVVALSPGFQYTSDNGSTWEVVNGMETLVIKGEFVRRKSGAFICATDGGMYESVDEGRSWHPFAQFFMDSVHALVERADGVLLAATDYALYEFRDSIPTLVVNAPYFSGTPIASPVNPNCYGYVLISRDSVRAVTTRNMGLTWTTFSAEYKWYSLFQRDLDRIVDAVMMNDGSCEIALPSKMLHIDASGHGYEEAVDVDHIVFDMEYDSRRNELTRCRTSYIESTVVPTTVTEQHVKDLQNAWPNPVSNVITFNAPFVSSSVECRVVDLFGIEVHVGEVQFDNGRIVIDVSELPSGAYSVIASGRLLTRFMHR